MSRRVFAMGYSDFRPRPKSALGQAETNGLIEQNDSFALETGNPFALMRTLLTHAPQQSAATSRPFRVLNA
jgi:hypothetical protein